MDDALALAYALRDPALELVGVSTVFGDVALRARIATELLDRAGAPGVPVVAGLGAPLTPGRKGRMFGHEGRGLFDDAAPRMTTPADADAAARVDALARALEAARPEALVAIGPMTNLGALVRAGHRLPPLTVMGGKLQDVMLPGMIPQIPEWNWWCDPRAVALVLGAPAASAPRIVPAEVTFRTRLLAEDRVRLAGGDALARTLGVLCDHWEIAQRERLGSREPRVMLHDPLAVASLVAPGLTSFAIRRIHIDDEGFAHHGPDGAEVLAATDVDNDALREHLLASWLVGGGAPA